MYSLSLTSPVRGHSVSQNKETLPGQESQEGSVFDKCAGLACLECSQTGLLQRVWMVRVPTMGIIKCQEFIGEKAVAVTVCLVRLLGGFDQLRHIPTN